jgi:hypothetical protein
LGPLMLAGPGAVEPKPDGTFSITTPFAGEFRVFATGFAPDMFLKDIRYRGASVLNRLISVETTTADFLEIELGARGGQLRGILLDDRRRPLVNVQAVLVPKGINPHPDLYKVAYSDASGRYIMRGIAPGDYTFLAWERPETSYFNAEYVRRFEGRGKAIHVSEGSTDVLDFQVIP